jgi:hypothetical protein
VVEVVDLVDNHQQPRNPTRGLEKQLPLRFRQRLAGVEHADGRIDPRQEVARDLGVVRVDRADPGRVDQLESGAQQLVVELNACELDSEPVLRIAGLGHIVGQLGHQQLSLAAVRETDHEAVTVARSDRSHGRGQRHHPGGQHVALEERVDQCALAALELSEHDQVEAVLGNPVPRRGQVATAAFGQQPVGMR